VEVPFWDGLGDFGEWGRSFGVGWARGVECKGRGVSKVEQATARAGFVVERFESCAGAGSVAGPSTALRCAQDDKF